MKPYFLQLTLVKDELSDSLQGHFIFEKSWIVMKMKFNQVLLLRITKVQQNLLSFLLGSCVINKRKASQNRSTVFYDNFEKILQNLSRLRRQTVNRVHLQLSERKALLCKLLKSRAIQLVQFLVRSYTNL